MEKKTGRGGSPRRKRSAGRGQSAALLLTLAAVCALALAVGGGGRTGPDPGGARPERGTSPEHEAPSPEHETPPDTPSAGADIGAEDPGPYAAALDALAEKNPEARAFVEGFAGETEPDLTLDLSGELTAGQIPYLTQWDARWGYCRYGSGLLGWTGCGPTALSMVAMGLTGDGTLTPARVADLAVREGYCVAGNGTDWRLFSEGAAELGLTAEELPLWEPTMRAELNAGRPIICIMGPGRFTDEGHYIVLTDCDEEGFTVLDPFRPSNCAVWSYEELSGEIKNLWSYALT